MLNTLQTLLRGASARAEDATKDRYAIELIDQKIREADAQFRAAKGTLATLIQRQRSEQRQLEHLESRIADLTDRATEALKAGREDLAAEAADAIATLEDEATLRRETVSRLESRVLRLRQSVEAGHRRLIDLRQGATTARALRREQDIQAKLNKTLAGPAPGDEAEDLIARVLSRDDPFEQAEILKDIDRDLSHEQMPERLADAGFGAPTRTRGADVLARLRAKT